MEIWSLGHSGFRLKGKEATVVIDPPAPAFGNTLKGLAADIVCITHDHPGHNYLKGIAGTPYVVRGPGEYEVSGVLISAMRTFHDAQKGAERGSNTIYLIHMEDLLIVHLGDLGHSLSANQQQEANGADILMIPVGGHSTIDAAAATEMVSVLEPSIILPMHYATPGDKSGVPQDPVEPFFHAMGMPVTEAQNKLVVTRTTIPVAPQIILLTPRG